MFIIQFAEDEPGKLENPLRYNYNRLTYDTLPNLQVTDIT